VAGRPRLRHGRIVLRGRSADRGCAALARVTVTVRNRKRQGSCRYLTPAGRLGHRQRCKHGPRLLARGTASWRLRVRAKLPRGRYILVARAVDTAGNTETAHHRGPNVARLRVRRR
jgi:hypothetical protein